MSKYTCYVSGSGWLNIKVGGHSIPVCKLNDAQTKEWIDASQFVTKLAENAPVVDNSREPIAVTLRAIDDVTGYEYNLPLYKDIINTLELRVNALHAAHKLYDLGFPLKLARTVIAWLTFHGFIDDKFLENHDSSKFSQIVIIPLTPPDYNNSP